MKDTLRERVVNDLLEYPKLKKKEALLTFRLKHPPTISEKELIESMALPGSSGDGLPRSGRISDRTMAIAVNYQDMAARMNEEVVMQISSELYSIQTKLQQIDMYLDMLPQSHAVVLRRFYLEGKPWSQIEDELHLCLRALTNRRDEALKELMEMYEFMGRVTGEFPVK